MPALGIICQCNSLIRPSFVQGIIYQQPLLNEDLGGPSKNTASASVGVPLLTLSKFSTCAQDIANLSNLHTNVIRSYAIDPAEEYSECMASLASASIFVLIDLTAPGYIIDGSNPQWTEGLYNRYTAVIDAMQVFNNTFRFLVGDDIAGPPNKISPFIRAAVRDMKNYMASKGYRNIPVGYAASDNGSTHGIAQYLACGDPSTAVGFLGINNRGWCEPDNYDTSGYRAMTSAYSLYPVPTFLAAYGCLSSDPGATEDFSEIAYIYCDMLPVMSGGFFYDFFSVNESSQYEKEEGAHMQSPGAKASFQRTTVVDKARALGPHMVDSTAVAELEDAPRMPEVEGRSTARELEGGSTEIFEAPADLSALPELLGTEH
ncbi:MAG: hypothetical protein Q9161_000146 [Pseudevernia consocians]